jgi:hypothetical protein
VAMARASSPVGLLAFVAACGATRETSSAGSATSFRS